MVIPLTVERTPQPSDGSQQAGPLLAWCQAYATHLHWFIDDRGRDALRLALPLDDERTRLVTVAANVAATPDELLAEAVGRMRSEVDAAQRRSGFRAVLATA